LAQVFYALVGVVTNKLDETFAFENQLHAKYSRCHTTASRFVGDNTNKGVNFLIFIKEIS